MSKTLQELRRQASSLRTMLSEMPPPWQWEDLDWRAPISAPATIGTEISLSAITEHFLLTWIEWFQVSRLYSRYFGHGFSPIMLPPQFLAMTGLPMFPGLPQSWASLHQRGQYVKDRAAQDGDLAEVWREAWHLHGASAPAPPNDDVEQWFLQLVESHARRRLLQVFNGFGDQAWAGLHRELVAYDRQLGEAFGSAADETREEVLIHLREYRHATLEVSWLSQDWQFGGNDSLSTVRRLTMEPVAYEDMSSQWILRLELSEAVRAHARALLSRLQQAVWEIGFAALSADVSSSDFVPGPWTPLATESVLVNPAPLPPPGEAPEELEEPEYAQRIMRSTVGFVTVPREFASPEVPALPPIAPGQLTVCIGRAGRGWNRFSRLIDKLIVSQRESRKRPELVVFLTDAWDSASFSQRHRRDLRALGRAGTQFMFLVAGVPDRRLSMLEVSI